MKFLKLNKKYLLIIGLILFLFGIIMINAKFIVKHFEFLSSHHTINLMFGLFVILFFIFSNYAYQKRTKRKRLLKKIKKNASTFRI